MSPAANLPATDGWCLDGWATPSATPSAAQEPLPPPTKITLGIDLPDNWHRKDEFLEAYALTRICPEHINTQDEWQRLVAMISSFFYPSRTEHKADLIALDLLFP